MIDVGFHGNLFIVPETNTVCFRCLARPSKLIDFFLILRRCIKQGYWKLYETSAVPTDVFRGASQIQEANVSVPSRGHERFLPDPYSVTTYDLITISFYVILAVETSSLNNLRLSYM